MIGLEVMAGNVKADLAAAAAAFGSLGGKARASALTPERRAEIAERAARARWGKPKQKRRAPKS